ncbi:hypothetical protein E3J49_01965 [Candidatus Bathyarchaeota archaeon]|nr:MAG: hypothetical protein E3J49_01965 [Candidatus Bathyarchaeota archaeon]
MKDSKEACQYYYADMVRATLSDPRLALPLRRYFWTLKRYVWYISVLGLGGFVSRIFPSTKLGKHVNKRRKKLGRVSSRSQVGEALNLQLGEWVEVRSVKEIFATLNAQGKLRGLRFTPEMVQFCGKRFRVYRRLEKIILEATGELRRIRTPTVLLDGVLCDGEAHGGCDRSCFCFWREAWLKRANP